ncbi:MAG: branched-chain amino acid ABC transporter substrate-binding protein [Gaiellales bacterium]|nr:branched-chain amino acid ABC transporter substrate-binding protein [Gaiellales bacterium]
MRAKRYLVLCIAFVVALGLVVAGCGESTTTTATGPATSATGGETTTTAGAEAVSLKIGAAGPFTGNLSKIGLDALQSVQFAVDDFNASGAMPGVTFTVEVGDDAGDPATAATVAQKFVDDNAIVGVVGPMTSAAVLSALPILNDANLGMLTQSATNDALAEGGYTVFHRICPADAVQGPSIAKFLIGDLGVKKAFIIDDKSTYGKGLGDQVDAALQAGGVTVERQQIAAEDKDFSSVLTKVKEAAPDILFTALPAPSQAAAVAKQMKSMGFEVQIMGGDGVNDPTEFIANAGGATEGAYATSLGPLASALPTAKEFLDRYIEKYQVTSAFTAQSYEATMVLLNAIKSVGVKDGKVDRKAVNDALGQIEYTGILDFPISFTPEGNLASGGIFIIQVKGDAFTQVKGITLE